MRVTLCRVALTALLLSFIGACSDDDSPSSDAAVSRDSGTRDSGDAASSDSQPPGDLTLQVIERDISENISDVELCLEGNTGVGCVKTDTEGKATLKGVPLNTDKLVRAKKAGFVDTLYLHGSNATTELYRGPLHTQAQLDADLVAASLTRTAGTGTLLIVLDGDDTDDSSVEIVGGGGDAYYLRNTSGVLVVDPGAKNTGTGASVGMIANLPVGDHIVQVKPGKSGVACLPSHAWGDGAGNRFPIKVEAGAVTLMRVACNAP